MNLSIYLSGYLGSQRKDTTHSGCSEAFRFGSIKQILKTTDELLLNSSGINTARDLPLAALLKKGDKVTEADMHSGSYYLLAQPVSLLLQRDSFGLSEVVKLTESEYELLTTELNAHFNVDDVVFEKSQTLQYWFVKFPSSLNVSTFPVQAVMHQNINALLPTGPDARRILTIINESQMLLHDHHINIEREALQQLPINSLWLSGEGALSIGALPDVAYAGEGVLFRSLLATTGQTVYSDVDALINSQVKQAVVVYEDSDQIDWDLVVKGVKSWKIKQLKVYIPNENATLEVIIKPWDFWKFWRKSQNKNAIYNEN